jgi:hypothetical protein
LVVQAIVDVGSIPSFVETSHALLSGDAARHLPGTRLQLVPNVSEYVARFTPAQQSLWTLFSGATHSRGWLVGGIEGPEAVLCTSILAPLIDTGDALAVEVRRYFGLNPREVVSRLHQHRVALLRRAAPSPSPVWGIDENRAATGSYPLPPRQE